MIRKSTHAFATLRRSHCSMRFIFSFFAISLLCRLNLSAQSDPADSLIRLLKNSDNDTVQIRLMNEIADVSDDTAVLYYASEAIRKLEGLPETSKNMKFYYREKAAALYHFSMYFNKFREQTDSGRKYLNLSLELARKADDPRRIGLIYNDIGVISIHKGPDSSIYWIEKSLPFTEAAKDSSQLAKINNNLGHLYRMKGDYLNAIDYLFKALRLDEQLGNTEDVSTRLNNIGLLFFELGMLDEALNNYHRSLAITLESGTEKAVAIRLNNIGSVHDEAGRLDSALIYYGRSLDIRRKLGQNWGIGESLGNIGNVWRRKGDTDTALSFFRQSLYYNRLADDSAGMANGWYNLADIFMQKKYNRDSAEWYLLQAYNYYKRHEALRDLVSVTRLLADLYSDKKEYAIAYAYMQEYMTAKDSMESKSLKKKALSQQFEFEYDQKQALVRAEQEKKDAVTALQIRNQKLIRNIFIGALAVALIIAGLLFNRYRLKQRTTRQLEEKNKIIEQEKQRAERSEQFKSQFLANMSHEIRTPMNAVMGFTNLLFDEESEQKRMQYLSAIKKSSENLLVVINDVLDLSKLEAGKMRLEKIPFRIREALQFVFESFEMKAEEKGLRLKLEVADDVPEIVLGDSPRLIQVLMNLVGNAIKFTEKGSVTLEITNEEPRTNSVKLSHLSPLASHVSRLTFHVTDTGIGIPDDQLTKIFDSFAQAHTSDNRKFGGTGLGLTISKNLIEAMDGKLEVNSEEGRGSSFSFTLPFEVATEQQLLQHHKKELIFEEDLGEQLAGISILVAEDNEYNQLLVVDTLKKFIPDVHIEVVPNGKDLLEKLRTANSESRISEQSEIDNSPFEIILMDVQMPEMDGYEATRNIRNNFSSPVKDIPIIALTASVIRTDIDKCQKAGMNSYVAKPFSEKDLLMEIAKVTGKAVLSHSERENGNEQPPSTDDGKLLDLTILKKFSGGDQEQFKKYVRLFVQTMPPLIEKLNADLQLNNVTGIKKTLHAMKPQLHSFAIKKTITLIEQIESNNLSDAEIRENTAKVIGFVTSAIKELKSELPEYIHL